MSAKITCLLTVYNEESRIGNFLAHATKWADELIVRDKGSTDATVAICEKYGVTPIQIPFSPDGTSEPDCLSIGSNDWVLAMTASNVPTKKLIDECRKIIEEKGDDLDLVQIPKILWSLGICSNESPWYISYQPFLYHRKRVQFSTKIHSNFSAPPERIGKISLVPDCFLAHMTHTSGEAFLRKHLEYAIQEVASDEPYESIVERCCINIATQFKDVHPSHELWAQKCGWNVYFFSIMLLAAERGKNHPKTYDEIAKTLIEKDWL